jgi:hypothetical protein
MSSVGYGALGSPTREPYNFRLEWAQALFFGSYEVRLYKGYGDLGPGLPHQGVLQLQTGIGPGILIVSYEVRLYTGNGIVGPGLPHLRILSQSPFFGS